MTPTATIHTGDALETLRTLPDRSVQNEEYVRIAEGRLAQEVLC